MVLLDVNNMIYDYNSRPSGTPNTFFFAVDIQCFHKVICFLLI